MYLTLIVVFTFQIEVIHNIINVKAIWVYVVFTFQIEVIRN